jgi:hypothetical protein
MIASIFFILAPWMMDSMLMAIHACPVAKWLAGPVPLSALVVNTSHISGLGPLCRVERQPRSSYTPKKSAV